MCLEKNEFNFEKNESNILINRRYLQNSSKYIDILKFTMKTFFDTGDFCSVDFSWFSTEFGICTIGVEGLSILFIALIKRKQNTCVKLWTQNKTKQIEICVHKKW